MPNCPKCGTTMVKFASLRSRQQRYSAKLEKIIVEGNRCPKCGCLRSIKETPLQKEKPKESGKIIMHFPPGIPQQ